MTTQQPVVLTPGQVWELTTEHGTRHLIDLRDPQGRVRRMRVPGEGRPEHMHDGRWQGRVGIVHHRQMTLDAERRHEVRIGESMRVAGPGVGDWLIMSPVIAVRVLAEDEVPPLGTVAYVPPDEDD